MAIGNTANWRVRAGGNNLNGGGYDASISGALSTTLSSSATSATTTIHVTSATGWPSSGNYYVRLGNIGGETFSSGATGSSELVQVTGGQGTTTWTVGRAKLGTTAQAFASGVVVDNDFSRCDTAPNTNTVGTSNASTTFVNSTSTFNATLVGNCLWLASGTNAIVGPYFVTAMTNTTTLVLDRNCSTGAMTNGVWKIGGAWADPHTNIDSSANILPGNSIFIRAGGSGSTSSADYAITATSAIPNGDNTNGAVRVIGENGRPFLSAASVIIFTANSASFYNLYVFPVSGGANLITTTAARQIDCVISNCIFDQNGLDITVANTTTMIGCEVFSSVPNSGTSGSSYAIYISGQFTFVNNNVHDTWGDGVFAGDGNGYPISIVGNIISKPKGDALYLAQGAYSGGSLVMNNTFDGGEGHGIYIAGVEALTNMVMINNIISNFTTAGKYGIYCNFNSTATNDRLREFITNNVFYNNTADALNLTVGVVKILPNGMVVNGLTGTDPQYVSATNENYAIGTNLKAIFANQFINTLAGKVPPISYVDVGGVQRQEAPNPTITIMS